VHVPRRFGSNKVPVGPRDPDNIYRRPEVEEYNRPLHINEDIIHTDAQAPQPGLSEFTFENRVMVKAIATAVFSIGSLWAISELMYSGKEQKVINPVYPYNGLRLEMGGVGGSKELYAGKKAEQEQLKAGKYY